MKMFLPIQKVEKKDDGTLEVWGVASSESRDSDGEMVKADAIKNALPEYFKYGSGPLREMHQLSAAGSVLKAEVGEDGLTRIHAKVVDPVAIKKVEEEVYKGFSIGGKKTSRDDLDKSIITGIRLNEISLADRPSNPDSIITLWKCETGDSNIAEETGELGKILSEELPMMKLASIAGQYLKPEELNQVDWTAGELLECMRKFSNDLEKRKAANFEGEDDFDIQVSDLEKREFSRKKREKDAESGKAMPDGSFPIENEKDLKNAIKAHGRAKDPEAAKKHIIKRAKALGLEDKLPEGWTSSTTKKETEKAESPDDLAKKAEELKKYMGEEVNDSRIAINCLSDLTYLLSKEMQEEHPEAAVQAESLRTSIASLKEFIVSEIQEDHSEDSESNRLMVLSEKVMDLVKSADNLTKAGARNSKGDMEKIQTVHDHSVSLGAVCNKASKAESSEDLAKVLTETKDELSKVRRENDSLSKRVKELEDQPAEGKGALRSVAKGEDVIKTDGTKEDGPTEEEIKKMSQEERFEYEMKKSLGKPVYIKTA